VAETPAGLRLASLVYHETWPVGTALAARCRRPLAALPWARLPLHEPPNRDCCCGIHAVHTVADAARYLHARSPHERRGLSRVVGTVNVWGRIVEGERGWRGGFAYPERLFVPTTRRRRAAAAALWPYRLAAEAVAEELAAYGVPVELVRERELRARRRARAASLV
jgi:hypothetical protein